MSRSDDLTESFSDPATGLPIEEGLLLDEACDVFEGKWRAGGRPDIHEAVMELPGSLRAVALRELIQLDVYYRRQRGESPLAGEYAARFSELEPAWLADAVAVGRVIDPDADHCGHVTGTAVPSTPPGYELLEEIGRGGMGLVYRARDIRMNRDVAVKLLQQKYAPTSLPARRFLEEAAITGQLQHPGIPPVHQVGELPDGRPYLAMKLIKGRTLADILADGSANRGTLIAVFEHVCQAVAYAHNHGVVHRDLKPANVMVGAFDEVQVMDWGLAKFRNDARVETAEVSIASTFHDPRTEADEYLRTRTGSFLGTPAYMSPEQAIGAIDHIDERSDTFGLGAVLCAILTGQPPFVADSSEATRQLAAQQKLDAAFARLDSCGAEPDLIALCKRCLSAERDARPRNAGVVARAVAELRADAEQRARQAEVERERVEVRVAEQRKRRRVQLAFAGAVGLLVLSGGVFGWYTDRQAEQTKLRQAKFEGDQARLVAEQIRQDAERKAEQSAFDTERRLKVAATREQVTRLLALATELRTQYRFAQAEAGLGQARDAATVGAADRLPAVDQARADLEFVVRLDAIRGKRSTWIQWERGEGRFDEAGAPPAYREAFAARGLDVVADPDGVGTRMAASAVRAELVSALDDWLVLETDSAVRCQVLTALRRADPDSGAAPFRDPAVRNDRVKLERLAAGVNVPRLSPGAVVAIAQMMTQQNLDAAPLLEHALSLHPRDFSIAFELGLALRTGERDPEMIGAYRAARAIRPDHHATLINLGLALQAKGDYEGAAAAHKEAVRLDPKNAPAHSNLGNALSAKGDYEGAIAAHKEAVRLDPKFTRAHTNLGVALYDNKDYDEAVAAHKEAIRLAPDVAPAHYNLGVALSAKGDYDGAIAAHKEAIRLDPKDPKAHNNLGVALQAKGNYDGAIAAHKEAIRLDPKNAAAHTNLGAALSGKTDYGGAVAAHKEAIRLDPKYALAHYNLGGALSAKGDYNGAEAAYREAIRHAPTYPEAHCNLGLLLQKRGRLAEALPLLRLGHELGSKRPGWQNPSAKWVANGERAFAAQEAIRLDPKDAAAHFNLGNALFDGGDRDGAIAAYQEAIRLDPKLADAHNNLGIALFGKEDYDGAAAAFKEAIRLDPTFAKAHNNLGNALQAKRKLDGAIVCYKEAIRLDPKLAPAHTHLGIALHAKRDYDGAAAAFREVIRLDPKNSAAHRLLGAALRMREDLDGAIEHLTEAVSLDPKDAIAISTLKAVREQKAEREARTAPPPREVNR
jgi:tetratricopeptide (TPR) repeat protein/tRNA A-37 threonylcarbamoyl transferase component Bud32